MLLNEMLEKHGDWLFKKRGYVPLALVPIIVVALGEFTYPLGSHKYDLLWEMFCFSVSIFGLFIRGFTVGYAPSGTSGRNTKTQKANTLNKEGMYSITRNPLYLGNFFAMLGVAMFPRVWVVVVVYILFFWLYYERIILAEERFLRQKFGAEYEEYCLKVPVFIPDFKIWIPPRASFSLRRVLRKEHSSFFSVVSAFTCLELIGDYVVEGRIVFDPVWVWIFLFTFFSSTMLVLLKKLRLLS